MTTQTNSADTVASKKSWLSALKSSKKSSSSTKKKRDVDTAKAAKPKPNADVYEARAVYFANSMISSNPQNLH